MTQETLKLALEALKMADELCRGHGVDFKEYGLEFDRDIQVKYKDAITAIKEALAQTQEPHGWYIDGYGAVIGTAEPKSVRVGEWLPWYTATPQRTEQEPDYWLGYGLQAHTEKPFEGATPVWTFPPQRTWVGLTDDEIEASKPPLSNDAVVWELAVEWAQAQLKEKNT